jgi:hypothetical protein
MNQRNEKLINETFDWMREVYQMYTENIIPARGFAKTSYACANCPVKKHCWAARNNKYGDGVEKVRTLVPPK